MSGRCNTPAQVRRSDAEIYREAARRVEEHGDRFGWSDYTYTCLAIRLVSHERDCDSGSFVEPYVRTFAPDVVRYCPEVDLQHAYSDLGDEAKDVRVLALCLMAAMVEAGDA